MTLRQEGEKLKQATLFFARISKCDKGLSTLNGVHSHSGCCAG